MRLFDPRVEKEFGDKLTALVVLEQRPSVAVKRGTKDRRVSKEVDSPFGMAEGAEEEEESPEKEQVMLTAEELSSMALASVNNIDEKLKNFDMGMDWDELEEDPFDR